MNVASWLKLATKDLDRLDAELILAYALCSDRTFLYAHPEQPLSAAQLNLANSLLAQRRQHVPLAYLLGHKEFYGRNFLVNPSVLIPRPETEAIIEFAKKQHPSSIIDVGTGSGCIAVTLALELPHARLDVTDISTSALNVAQANARNYHVLDRIRFFEADLFPENTPRYDLIAANLPYVDKTWPWNSPELDFEPPEALYSENAGLADIKRLIVKARHHLVTSGILLIESDTKQQPAILNFAQEHRFRVCQVSDYVLCLRAEP